jgi:hypothetical protein
MRLGQVKKSILADSERSVFWAALGAAIAGLLTNFGRKVNQTKSPLTLSEIVAYGKLSPCHQNRQ